MFEKLVSLLKEADGLLDSVQTKMEKAMATVQQFRDYIASIDAETTRMGIELERISTSILELIARIGSGNLSDTEEEEVLTSIQAQAERQKVLADQMKGVGTNLPA